ncbi:MAG: lipid asymmetry maintenance ABC transporter permease subunit MlaE [Gammaproteobacteria bacterium]|nr:lipid asymmetry maintenance ABC transporter permease subunit MlaE [Gammaproteobacteria bacterium]
MNWIIRLGNLTINFISLQGNSVILCLMTLMAFVKIPKRFGLFIKQLFAIGVLSISIIIVSGLFVGMVLSLQGYNTLVNFGAEESLGVVVALSLLRELSPVVGALLFAGRAGSSLTAEIGLMKATEQISAMEMMAIDPIEYILAPRLLAGIIALPLLIALFSLVGIYGGALVAIDYLGVDNGAFWSQMQAQVDIQHDLMSGMIKSVVFGFVVTWIAIYQGYSCIPTSEGVSRATTHTVVFASLAVLGLDFVLTAAML